MGFAFTWKLEAWLQVGHGQFAGLWFTLPCWVTLPLVSLGENGAWEDADAVAKGGTKGPGRPFENWRFSRGLPVA